MMSLVKDVIGRFGRIIGAWRGRHVLAFVNDDPDTVMPGKIYIVGEDGHPWFAVMACPCGCGETIKLAMVQGSRPRWSFVRHWDGTLSLNPSVWRRIGCQSHFWMRRGRVDWC